MRGIKRGNQLFVSCGRPTGPTLASRWSEEYRSLSCHAACHAEEQYVQQYGSGAQHWGACQSRMTAISRRDVHLQVGIVSTLESHWVVLDAELSEVRKDFGELRTVRANNPTHSCSPAPPCGGSQRRASTVTAKP